MNAALGTAAQSATRQKNTFVAARIPRLYLRRDDNRLILESVQTLVELNWGKNMIVRDRGLSENQLIRTELTWARIRRIFIRLTAIRALRPINRLSTCGMVRRT
ncbi:hypothetical protein [Glutamicibacter soli]